MERVAAAFSDLELYQSEEDFMWAKRMRLKSPDKMELLGNGIDLNAFDPGAVDKRRLEELRRQLDIPPGSKVVGTVSRLVAEKGIREFLAASKDVRKAFPNTYFLVVGGADTEKEDAIAESELEGMDHLRMTGWRKDVNDLIALMDIFVLASWREGLPRSAMESAAMAKPMVLTNIRGCREVARDGVEAILVEPRDPKGLAEAITALLRDADRAAELSRAARARALDHFDEENVVQKIVDSYEQLLEDKKPLRRGRRLLPLSVKRAMDVAGSLLLLVVLAPLVIALSILIKVRLGSPILFRQQRLGYRGNPFTLLKFRTMSSQAGSDGALLPDRERLTGFGRVLRSLSLDELPELLNVLKGDLSLVGPRPLLPEYRDLYSEFQWRRHEVRPGVTGPVQVKGRNKLSWDEKFRWDVWYVDNWNLWVDLKILFETVWKTLKRDGISQPGQATVEYFQGNSASEGEVA